MPETFASILRPLRARIGLIANATPVNVEAEFLRLGALAARGEFHCPKFEYVHAPDMALARKLAEVAAAIPLYDAPLRQRADELLKECELSLSVGTSRFGELADARFWCEALSAKEARALATEWLRFTATEDAETFRTDSGHSASLLSQMNVAVRQHSPHHRVVTRSGMTALAATGDECVYVARDRSLSEESGRRVVVHEVYGHVVPRVRAHKR